MVMGDGSVVMDFNFSCCVTRPSPVVPRPPLEITCDQVTSDTDSERAIHEP